MARAALARKEMEGEFDHEQHLRSVGALDAQWRGFARIAVSNVVAYRAGEIAERYALRGFDARLVDAARGASVPVYEEA